ncbi:MAG: hypothetical protein HFJ75_07275 [Eggerthellaceae bacterium]|nr:hypothetical protein [Eggerthellaceae bacterium]
MSPQLIVCLTGFALLVCCVASEVKLSGFVALAALIAFTLYAINEQREFLFIYTALLFAVFANIAGCAVAEYFPIYLSEIRIDSSFAGSLPSLVFARWFFLAALFCFGCRGLPKVEEACWGKGWIERLITVGVFLALVAMFLVTIRNPPSFLVGMDRFAYASAYQGAPIQRMLTNAMPYLTFLIVAATRWGMKPIGWLGVVMWGVVLIWTGTKFGGFFNLACAFLVVYSDRLARMGKHAVRKFSIILGILLAALVAFSAVMYGSYGAASGSDFLFARTAQQGQIWWATYEKTDGLLHLDRVESELLGTIKDGGTIAANVGSGHGIYGMMYLNAPTDLIDGKLRQGSRYTEGGYAAAYYSGGVLGALSFSLLMAGAFFLVIRRLRIALWRGKAVEIIILARFFIILQTTLSMGTFADLIDPLSLASYAYLAFAWLTDRGVAPEVSLRSRLLWRSDAC